ncbi:MAG: hypothetical protein MJZ05_04430 [Fibrobacter sp.]|nr:hypothetical protein [Fibrobacter sp.]
MIAFPFVYFLSLYIWIIHRRTALSVASMMVLMYVITSFFAIVIDVFDLYHPGSCIKTEINLLPTFLYCFLLTLVMYPFFRINDKKIVAMAPLARPYFVDVLVHFYFVLFLVCIFILPGDIIRNWTYAQLHPELKGEIWAGDYQIFSFSGPLLSIAHFCMSFSSASLFLIPFFFYNVTYRLKSKIFLLENLCGSAVILLFSLLTQDRSKFVYWLLIFILCYVFFQRFFTNKLKKTFSKVLFVLLGVVSFYIVVMNFIRFGQGTVYENPALNLVNYAGQSFNNFCYFFENLDLPNRQWDHPFPFLSHVFAPDYLGTLEWAIYLRFKTGINVLVFSTFIGQIATYIGFGFTILWCIGITIFTVYVLKKSSVYSLYDLMKLIILAIIPYLGLFVYFYGGWKTEMLSFLFLFLSYKASTTKKIKDE